MKVYNLESPRSGAPVANQFVITEEGRGAFGNFVTRKTFQSYESTIAEFTTWPDDSVDVVLDEKYWNYSRTTSKYRNQFLGETTEETRKKIESGEYQLADLNK